MAIVLAAYCFTELSRNLTLYTSVFSYELLSNLQTISHSHQPIVKQLWPIAAVIPLETAELPS